MIYLSIFAFALALGACVCAGAAWITSTRRTRELESWRSTTAKDLRSWKDALVLRVRELDKQTPAKLAAEVAELSEAVDKLREIQRRFAGRFDAHVAHEHAKAKPNGAATGDDEIDAMLQLQKAGPAGP